MRNRMIGGHVLHVITDTNRRGAQIFATQLRDLLSRDDRPHRVVALGAGRSGAQLEVPVLGHGTRSADSLRALRAAMRETDLVVAHGSGTLLASTVAGVGLRVPVVYRNISDPAYWLGTAARRFRVAAMLRRVEAVVALWPGGKDYLVQRLGLPAERIRVIPNGVPLGDFRPPTRDEQLAARRRFGVPDTAPVLVYAASLQPEKHPQTAVEALRHLPPDTRLVMIGDGPLRDEVTGLAEEVAPGRVVVAGQVDDALNAYWAADLMVLPSEGEGLPAVLIEAGLCGRPAVASTSGGNADIVLDGRTGVVVDPADPRQLADGVTTVLADLETLGQRAAAHCAERYDLTSVARQWDELLTACRHQHQGVAS
jgi:glycosyltransferase involved in cell wall biosynthesis